MNKKAKRTIKIAGVVAAIFLVVGGLGYGCSKNEGVKRAVKSIKSEYTGGLKRRVTAYDYNGNKLGTWEGKFDVEMNDTRVYFEHNGKRVILYNSIVINEEI